MDRYIYMHTYVRQFDAVVFQYSNVLTLLSVNTHLLVALKCETFYAGLP